MSSGELDLRHYIRIIMLIESTNVRILSSTTIVEAALLLSYYFKKKKLRYKVELELYSPAPGPMVVAGKELSASVRALVESKGIKYYFFNPAFFINFLNRVSLLISSHIGWNFINIIAYRSRVDFSK